FCDAPVHHHRYAITNPRTRSQFTRASQVRTWPAAWSARVRPTRWPPADEPEHDRAHDHPVRIHHRLHRISAELAHHLAQRLGEPPRVAVPAGAEVPLSSEVDPSDLDVLRP